MFFSEQFLNSFLVKNTRFCTLWLVAVHSVAFNRATHQYIYGYYDISWTTINIYNCYQTILNASGVSKARSLSWRGAREFLQMCQKIILQTQTSPRSPWLYKFFQDLCPLRQPGPKYHHNGIRSLGRLLPTAKPGSGPSGSDRITGCHNSSASRK